MARKSMLVRQLLVNSGFWYSLNNTEYKDTDVQIIAAHMFLTQFRSNEHSLSIRIIDSLCTHVRVQYSACHTRETAACRIYILQRN